MRLDGPDATQSLGAQLAKDVCAGISLLLSGPTGAGKSLLARSLIQTAQAGAGQPPEDVPSPTFTLVQTYMAGDLEIWHADLYRLSNADELIELGLMDAFDSALTLIEWPDRLGPDQPESAVLIDLAISPDGRARTAQISGPETLIQRLLGDRAA